MVGPRFEIVHSRRLCDFFVVNVHVCSDILAEYEGTATQVEVFRRCVCHLSLQLAVKASPEYLALDFVQG